MERCDAYYMASATKRQKTAPSQAKPTATAAELSDESGVENLSAVSDSDLDDEFEVAEKDNDEGSGDDSDSGEESDSFPMRKKKKNTDDGKEQFATAFNAILGSKLKAYDRKDPILARNKTTLKKLESDKLENKAKRAILAEKKELHDKHRVKNLLPSEPEKVSAALEGERRLKKVAQRGVVKLFNAVLATQVRTDQEVGRENVGSTKKEELVNEISKLKFLDLVRAAGDD